jgi:hypothetical protein
VWGAHRANEKAAPDLSIRSGVIHSVAPGYAVRDLVVTGILHYAMRIVKAFDHCEG